MVTGDPDMRSTSGVLAGWQIYWTARPLSYLNPIFRGIIQAAADLGCNLLLGCGLGPTASASDPLRPAWPFPSPDTDFVPIGPCLRKTQAGHRSRSRRGHPGRVGTPGRDRRRASGVKLAIS